MYMNNNENLLLSILAIVNCLLLIIQLTKIIKQFIKFTNRKKFYWYSYNLTYFDKKNNRIFSHSNVVAIKHQSEILNYRKIKKILPPLPMYINKKLLFNELHYLSD